MSRDVDSAVAANLARVVTRPATLVSLGYSSILRLASTWPTPVQHGGLSWEAGGAAILRYSESLGGKQKATIDVPHSSAVLGENEREALFRLEGFKGQAADCWWYDPAEDIATPMIIGGYVDAGNIGDFSSVLTVTGPITDRVRVPRTTFGAPAFRHNLPANTRLEWQGDVVRLESE